MASQFLLAVHQGRLSVRIEPGGSRLTRQIDRLTPDTELETLDERDPGRHYDRAIISKPELTGQLRQIGTVRIWTDTSKKTKRKRCKQLSRRTNKGKTSEKLPNSTGDQAMAARPQGNPQDDCKVKLAGRRDER